jgi:oxalate decarboxylase
MTYGNCRVTVLDTEGRPYVADVKEGDLWYFPTEPRIRCRVSGRTAANSWSAFDDGHVDEFNTLLVTDWFAHTPPEVLAKNFGVPAESFAKIPLHNLWIFQGTTPRWSGRRSRGSTESGARAASPFYLPTWHPNADEWQYHIKGKGRMTVFNTGTEALTMDFAAGDIGYVNRNLGHYVENVGDTELQFVGVFRPALRGVLAIRLAHTHRRSSWPVDEATIAKWPGNRPRIMPKA